MGDPIKLKLALDENNTIGMLIGSRTIGNATILFAITSEGEVWAAPMDTPLPTAYPPPSSMWLPIMTRPENDQYLEGRPS
jgi:hypothetical protein